MSKCNDCKYYVSEIDGEEQSFGDHAYISSIIYYDYCDKGYCNEFENKGVDCNGFKERK